MEASDFIAKLKADGSVNDNHDLEKQYADYKLIAEKLPSKDKGAFSLNVLCILSRNIDKIPTWRDKIDCKVLLTLAIDCVRSTRCLNCPERIKTLACVYHIHRCVVKQQSLSPPELVLKLSYMPFENDSGNLLKEHCKTYWHLLADRLMYIEKLKTLGKTIIKLLPKLLEDIEKIIHIYDGIQFCSTVLVFLLKKLHYLYSGEYAKPLNTVFGKIFEYLSQKKDVDTSRKLSEMEILELYVKFSDSFYIIAENGAKLQFKDCCLNAAIIISISFIGHAPDMFHCLQTFYSNSFCSILSENSSASHNDTVISCLKIACETTEKMGYLKAMKATYPYINQLLRLYIEYKLASNFTEASHEICLNMMLLLLEKLENTEQLLKCDGCKIKSSLHDAFRLSLSAKYLISSSLDARQNLTKLLDLYLAVVENQHRIMKELCRLGCPNYDKCLRKLQTDIHNTAILLNKAEYFDHAIKLFNTYITHEFLRFKTEQDLKHISRALYNKSICELERKSYENALMDAFLSLIFSLPEGLTSDKYMSLVIDIKAKSLKSRDDEDPLQLMTVLDAGCLAVEKHVYVYVKSFFRNVQFSSLLHHEFSMYAKLWPSLAPIAGVWKALYRLLTEKQPTWILVDKDTTYIFHTVIMSTPTFVRTIQNPVFSHIITSLLVLQRGRGWRDDVKTNVVEATLLFLKSEFCMAEAAIQYEWKCKDQTIDPDMVPYTRTIEQEYEALKPAIKAIEIWTKILPLIDSVSDEFLRAPLLVLRVTLQQLLLVRHVAPALQLAHIAMALGRKIDRAAYLEAAGVALSLAPKPSPALQDVLAQGAVWAGTMLNGDRHMENALLFICDAAIYYHNIGHFAASAEFLRVAQSRVLASLDGQTDSLAVGRLLDGTARFGDLSANIDAQRHYLLVGNQETNWCARQRRSLLLKGRISDATERVVALARRLCLFKRSRAAAASALGPAGAQARLALSAQTQDPCRTDTARKTIDLNLKYILGLPANDAPSENIPHNSKESEVLFTPEHKHFEIMRDVHVSKAQTSPTVLKEYVPTYKPPKFFEHEHNCTCYACETPSCLILACQIFGLEASTYFRAKEIDIAKNYFDGVISSFSTVENKLKIYMKELEKRKYANFVVDVVEKIYEADLLNVELDILMAASFFELSLENYTKADYYIHNRIQEIFKKIKIDSHLYTEIMNLMTMAEIIRRTAKNIGIENDFDNMRLTPTKEILKTPEANVSKPPVLSKVVVNKDELPEKKLKVPLLNFDDAEESNTSAENLTKESIFRIPVPITAKPKCEPIPRSTRSKVRILVTTSSDDLGLDIAMTPQTDKSRPEFFTPINSTPEQFFTPATSVKTNLKNSLWKNIAKNLEEEFGPPNVTNKDPPKISEDPPKPIDESKGATKVIKLIKTIPKPTRTSKLTGKVSGVSNKVKADLEVPKRHSRVEAGTMKPLTDSRLKRSTSPGNLPKEVKPTRGGRLPRPTNFVDKNNGATNFVGKK